MRDFHLITVGKIKGDYLSLEKEYSKRLSKFSLTIHELKSLSEDVQKEGELIDKCVHKIGGWEGAVLLTEHVKPLNTENFAEECRRWLDSSFRPIFIIGGAAGFSEAILKKAKGRLSLSPLTFPHQMARVILVEQLYRAQTILEGHPYHK